MSKELSTNIYEPTTFEEANTLAITLSESTLVPKDFQRQPGNVMIAMQMGRDVGLSATQALQSIAVINGRPCLWGDAVIAIIKNHSKYEWMKESYDEETHTATCEMKRKGEKYPVVKTFSWADADLAGLTTRDTYKKYPKRMLQMRARSWAARDCFPDALKGLSVAEEMQDADLIDMGDAEVVSTGPGVSETKPSDIKTSPEKVVDPDLQKGKIDLEETTKSDEDLPDSTKKFIEELEAGEDKTSTDDDNISDAEITEVEPKKDREPGEDDDIGAVAVDATKKTNDSVVSTQKQEPVKKTDPDNSCLLPRMVTMAENFLVKYSVDKQLLLDKYGVNKIEELPRSEASGIMKWIQTQAK